MRNEIISAEMVSIQRDGGYKDPFKRVVMYSYNGYGCLYNLENDLFTQLHSEYQNSDGYVKKMLLGKVTKK